MRTLFGLLGAGVCLSALAAAQTPVRYLVTDLGVLPGGNFSQATYLNDDRLVVGLSTVAGGAQHAVFWGGPFRVDVGAPGLNSGAFSVNQHGEAAVQAEIPANDPNNENFCGYGTGLRCLAFLWQKGVLTQLPTLGGPNGTVGAINNAGQMSGLAETATVDPECPKGVLITGTGPQILDYKAVIWGPAAGQIRTLQPLAGDTVSFALWINEKGQAVGGSGRCGNTVPPPIAVAPHAVFWDTDGSVQDMGNLGGTSNLSVLGVGNVGLSLNNQGQVVGAAAMPDEIGSHAFLWSKTAGIRDLGILPGDASSGAVSINDSGAIVGPSMDATGNPRGFLWQNGQMQDLNDLALGSSLYLLWPTAINASGEISGFGADANGDIHGFLAVPTGESAANAANPLKLARPAGLPESLRVLLGPGGALARYRLSVPRPR